MGIARMKKEVRYPADIQTIVEVVEEMEEHTGKSCYCDEPPPGESGTIECENCTRRRWSKALRGVLATAGVRR